MRLFKKKSRKLENLLFNFPSGSRYAESFRTLRTNLNFSAMGKGLNAVVITSSVESEGKTNTAVNLAYTMAQSGSQVLLIDTDLRRPRMTEAFALKKNKGFTDLVSSTFSLHLTDGNLEEYTIGDLQQLIKLQKRTGELSIDTRENSISIFFVSGHIVDIYWKNRPESKKLANTLIQKKLLSKKEASLALGHQKKSVQRLGTILYTMGLVSKEKLSKELAIHMVEAMRIISTMDKGQFNFKSLLKNEIKSPISQGVDFEKLFKEFIGQGEELVFINNEIDSAVQSTPTENLYILPSGKIPPNPSEIIGSDGAEFLMELLKKKFDFVILDTPPVMPATDAMLMAPRTDGTILVIKSGNTERKVVKGIIDNYQRSKLPILGILLNLVDLKKEGYYRYYKKYYASYYGEK